MEARTDRINIGGRRNNGTADWPVTGHEVINAWSARSSTQLLTTGHSIGTATQLATQTASITMRWLQSVISHLWRNGGNVT